MSFSNRHIFKFISLAQVERFELPSKVLETSILPLNYTRVTTLPTDAFRQRECKGKRNSEENKYSILFQRKKAAPEESRAAFFTD